MLRDIIWQFVTNVASQPICLIFQRQAAEKFLLDCLVLEVRTDKLYRNVGEHLPLYVA